MTAWLYTRKSRALGDADDPHLLSHHIAALKLLAARDRVVIPEANVRVEIGSGESIAGRPVFAELLREWERLPANSGGVIYLTEPSRLSRGSNQERGRILDALIRAQLTIASPERRYDPANPSDELTFALVQSVDRAEVLRYRQRVALRRSEMTRNGELLTGTPPWGYRWVKSPGQIGGRKVPGHLEAHPDRFPLLVAICREVLTASILRLAARYGVQYGILQYTLHNPVICGFPAKRYGPHHGAKAWSDPLHLLPPEQWVWPEQPGDYPAACTRGEWEAIQAVIAERHSLRLKTGPAVDHGWCRPVVTFTNCPGPTKLGSVKLFRGMMPTYTRTRPDAPPLYIARETVHPIAQARLRAFCQAPLADKIRQLVAEQTAAPDTDLAPIRRRLAVERERFAVLKGQLAAPELEEEEQRALIAAERECRRAIERLKTELNRPEPAALPDLSELLPGLDGLAAAFDAVWEEMPGVERQEIVTALLKEIPVTVVPGKRGVRWERHVNEPALVDWLRKV